MAKHTDSLTAHSSISSSPLLLGDTSANSMTAGWDARTPLAGWLILHKDTQALFVSTLFISSCLPETLRDQTVPDGHFNECLMDEETAEGLGRETQTYDS